MKIFAYTVWTTRKAVGMALGVKPITSPPMLSGDFSLEPYQDYDFYYFGLHGFKQVYGIWFGEGPGKILYPALELHHLRDVDLSGAIVTASCYGVRSPFISAFYDAGAESVIAGSGKNYAGISKPIGADLLAAWIVNGLRRGMSVEEALKRAKIRLLFRSRGLPNRDAVMFGIQKR